MPGNIESVTAAIDYIESHLQEKPDLERIAEAVHYSKYYLHRMFIIIFGAAYGFGSSLVGLFQRRGRRSMK